MSFHFIFTVDYIRDKKVLYGISTGVYYHPANCNVKAQLTIMRKGKEDNYNDFRKRS